MIALHQQGDDRPATALAEQRKRQAMTLPALLRAFGRLSPDEQRRFMELAAEMMTTSMH